MRILRILIVRTDFNVISLVYSIATLDNQLINALDRFGVLDKKPYRNQAERFLISRYNCLKKTSLRFQKRSFLFRGF